MVGEVKTKKTYKEEIITMIKEIEDYKILRRKSSALNPAFLLEYKFFEKFT